jgi:predicted phosphodiesterase
MYRLLVNILSDLHLSLGALEAPDNDADVVILAGDIARPREAIAWAARIGKPVVYVAGNHEFYGASLGATIAELKDASAGTSVRVLDDEPAVIGGVRFLGSTLWTDFMLFGIAGRAHAMQEGRTFMRDFTRIRRTDDPPLPFTPEDAAARFAVHAQWLQARLSDPFEGPTVVITHHAPSPRSVHPRFEGSPINACFVSDAEHLLGGDRAQLWIHGHTHDSFDYVVDGTRVVCNPRGYAKNGINENPAFDPNLCIEIA